MRLLALALALAMAFPLADAQMTAKEVSIARPVPPGIDMAQPVYAEFRIDLLQGVTIPFDGAWLLAGHDNRLNLTVVNAQDKLLNVTFRVNATGAAVTPDVVSMQVRPGLVGSEILVVRPDDVGTVEIRAEAEDAFQAGGSPLTALFTAVSVALPAARLIDPPLSGTSEEGYQSLGGYGGTVFGQGHVRVRSGEAVVPKIELRNVLSTATPPFRVSVLANFQDLETIDVPALEPGETRTVEFDEYVPMERGPGMGFGGGVARMEMRFRAVVNVGGVEPTLNLADYRIENGVVRDVLPLTAVIDVQDGVALDLLVPTNPVLGAPMRIKYNVTNNGDSRASGNMILTLETPGRLFYEVQGPETHHVSVDLGPGERVSGAIDFTPRVSGYWSVSNFFMTNEGFGYGGGGGVLAVPGPVSIRTDAVGPVYARIGEPVRIDLSIATTRPLQDAQLRVTSGATRYVDPTRNAGAGDFQPGMAQRLLASSSEVTGLDTLQPGGTLNASIEISGRSAGRYTVIPYVLAEGFAYTSDPDFKAFREMEGANVFGGGVNTVDIAVQPRAVDAAWAIAPFFLALAFFVGTWTMRTRFVK